MLTDSTLGPTELKSRGLGVSAVNSNRSAYDGGESMRSERLLDRIRGGCVKIGEEIPSLVRITKPSSKLEFHS